MLSRLNRQAFSVYRQKILPCFQEQVRRNTESTYRPQWENEVITVPKDETLPWREKLPTDLSEDAPSYPTIFESPTRDLVNFPRRECPEVHAPTRLVIIPETWFKFMYPKMGVSGPYTLGLGVFLFLAQKEYFITHGAEWKHIIAWYMWWYVFSRTQLGNIVCYIMDYGSREMRNGSREYEALAKKHRIDAIEEEKRVQAMAEGTQFVFDAKKENVGLQLEAAYRQTAMDIYNQVKRRLDYQVEVGKIDSRIKQQFMVNWVISQVQQSLSKTSEADTLKQCLIDLNKLAARA